jgi:hypothetical protein
VSEELTKTTAKVVEAGLTVLCQRESVLGTPAITHHKPRTGAALRRKSVPLVITEATLDRCIG